MIAENKCKKVRQLKKGAALLAANIGITLLHKGHTFSGDSAIGAIAKK